MYIRTVFVQISDNYLLADLNRYMGFCLYTDPDFLLDCFDILLYFYAKFRLFCVFEFFGCYLWLLNNAPLYLKIFCFCFGGFQMPPLMDEYPCFDGLASLLGFSNVALVGLVAPSDG